MRPVPTFRRALKLFATISGRSEYTDPGEKFEDVTLLLFDPGEGRRPEPSLKLFEASSGQELSEAQYYQKLRNIYNTRNPHAAIEQMLEEEKS